MVKMDLDPCKTFIGQLRTWISRDELSAKMQSLGIPGAQEIHILRKGDQMPSCAFVTYDNAFGASECVRLLNNQVDSYRRRK